MCSPILFGLISISADHTTSKTAESRRFLFDSMDQTMKSESIRLGPLLAENYEAHRSPLQKSMIRFAHSTGLDCSKKCGPTTPTIWTVGFVFAM